MPPQYSALDIFSGAGGLTEGFNCHKFDFVAHIEMNNYAAQTLETREIYHTLKENNAMQYYEDYFLEKISRDELINEWNKFKLTDTRIINKEISNETINSIFKTVESQKTDMGDKDVDVLIGGPPCQAYSIMGRSRSPDRMVNDPRNYLYLQYIKFIKKYTPELFVFENVPGIRTAKNGDISTDFQKKVDDLNYHVEARMLHAERFSVLQTRKRIIFIGWKKEHDFEYPPSLQHPEYEQESSRYRIWDLLKDLPHLEPGEGTDSPHRYINPPSKYLQKTKIRTKKDQFVVQHKARSNLERDKAIYRHAISIWDKEKKRIKYNELPDCLEKTHKNTTSFLDRFKVVNGDGLSHSVVAHISKDGHYYIHPDLNQARSLTVREAARIQSFPDDYKFEGPRTARFVQIGNAVPPLMAEGIAGEIKKMLKEIK